MLRSKNVASLPAAGSDETKRSNEIDIAIPLPLDRDTAGKDIIADALRTQRVMARHVDGQLAHSLLSAQVSGRLSEHHG